MINFLELIIQNFMAVGSAKIDLHNQGLVSIEGVNKDDPSAKSNGAGKSSIADAISWVLFGETARGVNADGVVNVKAGKETSVELKLVVDGLLYKVRRGRKHSTLKNRVELLVFDDDDGLYCDRTGGTDKITQEKINNLLGCTADVFNAAIYMGQEAMPDLPGMTDKKLKSILEQALGIDKLDEALDNCKEQLASAEYAYERERENLENLKGRIYDIESTKKSLERDIADISTAIEDSKLDLESKTKLWDKEDVAIMEKINRLTDKENSLKKLLATLPKEVEVSGELSAIEEKIDKASLKRQEITNKNVALGKDITMLERQIWSLDKEHSCHECGRAYDADHLEDLERQKRELNQQLKECRDNLDANQKTMDRIIKGICTLTDTKTKLLKSRDAANKESIELNRDISMLAGEKKAEVGVLTAKREGMLAMSKFIKDRNAKQTEMLNAKQDAYNKVLANLVSVTMMIRASEKALEEKEINVRNLEKVSYILGRKGFRGEILDQITPFLNIRTNHYLSQLTNDNITASWDTIGYNSAGDLVESFHIDISHTNGIKKFASLSGGERRKVRLACALALQDLIALRATKPIKLFIADEIDDAIDVAGLELLMSVLEQKAKDIGTVLIISHNELADWCKNIITMVKEDGYTTVEVIK